MDQTFRPRSNYVWAGGSFILILLFIVNSFWVADSFAQISFELMISAALGVIVYLIWIKPKMVLEKDVIKVVNPFRTDLIAYSDILELETKWSLSIVHRHGKSRVWVAPATGKQRWIADKKFGWYGSGFPISDAKNIGMESMSASLDSVSGQAAYLIRERIKRAH
jgi:hypothetical protein